MASSPAPARQVDWIIEGRDRTWDGDERQRDVRRNSLHAATTDRLI
jgi:hypothetical protein